LDGSRVLRSLLPVRSAEVLNRLEPYGMFLILGLLMLNSYIPIISSFIGMVFQIFQRLFLPAFIT
ncbi:MAG: hypothetical protein WBO24_05240, partial [Nitrospirales bacterium]